MKLVLASGNAGKLVELRELLAGSGIELIAQTELGIDDAEETGLTFVENAILKARHAARASGLPALADDSGLCVDALDGAPGLYSARYAGVHGDNAGNNAKLLRELEGVPDAQRTAHFTCVLALLRNADDPDPLIATGRWPGRVLHAPSGDHGFGYDPVFLPDDGGGLGSAELDPVLKNRISHRGQALAKLREMLFTPLSRSRERAGVRGSLEKNRKIANARALRHHGTEAEHHLWRFLRNRQLGEYRFRRQAPLGRYIADFACMEAKLIVELDGGQHAENTIGDELRTQYLKRGDFRVLRFWNDDVLLRTDDVLAVIFGSLEQSSPHPGPLPQAGEGEKQRALEASCQSASRPRKVGEKHSPPLSLYIHIPWCVKKCPYCDFNSHGLRAAMPEREYVAALLADMDGDLADFGDALQARKITSVFLGGGTPSLFAPDSIAAILDGASAHIPFARDCEITLETNPGTVEHGRFDGYLKAGVNRISFGVQSFDDEKLRVLGRIHSSREAEAAVKLAQDAGYANINLDLMYALPQQTLDGALADIEHAIALQPTHISHYQLTLEPGTPFAKRPPPLPGHDAAWDMQEACQARLAEAGYAQYEVSAYAQPGKRCRHNLNYWTFGDYLGIGAGAHGKISGLGTRDPGLGKAEANFMQIHRRWKIRSPVAYLQHASAPQRIGGNETIASEQLPFEFMLNALRLNDGVPIADFTARTGLPEEAIAAPLHEARAKGWLTEDTERLQATPLGQRFLNDLIEVFLPDAPERPHA